MRSCAAFPPLFGELAQAMPRPTALIAAGSLDKEEALLVSAGPRQARAVAHVPNLGFNLALFGQAEHHLDLAPLPWRPEIPAAVCAVMRIGPI